MRKAAVDPVTGSLLVLCSLAVHRYGGLRYWNGWRGRFVPTPKGMNTNGGRGSRLTKAKFFGTYYPNLDGCQLTPGWQGGL